MSTVRSSLAGLVIVLAGLLGMVPPARGQQAKEAVICDMDTARHRPTTFGEKKTLAGTVEVVEGKLGRACRFNFAAGAQSGFFAAAVKASPDWDSNVRGPRYKEYLEMAVDRVRRATKGQAEVLLMTTCPGFAAWETRNELCVAASWMRTRPAGRAAAPGETLLSSFEPGQEDLVDVFNPHDHDVDVQLLVRDPQANDYLGLRILEGSALRKFRDHVLLKTDVVNPQDKPIRCTARIDDAASKDYGSRYNDDDVVMPPGRSTFEIMLNPVNPIYHFGPKSALKKGET